MRHYLTRKIKDFPFKVISKFKNHDPEQAISLFCDPRGGSTWLAEILNNIPDSIIVEEPLHLNNITELNTLGFFWRQYIPENESWEAARTVFQQVLAGRKLNARICRINTIGEVFRSKQLIMKIIRGKALLPWYVQQFNFKYKPLVVVRHPFALAASMLSHSAWNYEFRRFETPKGPYTEFYKLHEAFLYSLQTKEEQLTAFWCMINNVVLNHPDNNQSWITINYENLVLEPMKFFQMIFDQWQIDLPDSLEQKILNPSSSTRGKSTIIPQKLLSDWQGQLKPEQIRRLQKVLDYFNVTYYGEDIMPLIPANAVHLKKTKE